MDEHSPQFDALFEDPNLLVALLDSDGTVRRINDTALEYVDSDEAALVGTPFWETPWWSADHVADVKQWIGDAADGDYVEYEAEHPAADGTTAVVSGVFRPVTDADGDVTGIVVSAKDITERRQQQRELQAQNKRIDEFASFVSHDLQSPISVVDGRIELALETGDLAHLERAKTAIDRIDSLREDLVATLRSREIVTSREPVDVAAAFADAWRLSDPPSAATYDVVDDPTVEADPDAMQRLFVNLVGNSIEHGAADATVRVGELDAGGFYYADDGPGIDPAARGQVFIPGFSTKRDEHGIGMGMASIRQIVTAHDWQIEIEDSDALGGVRFELYTDNRPGGD